MKKDIKRIFSFHVNYDDLMPATDAEKDQTVLMKKGSTFFKDGMKRLLKNPIAMICLSIITIIVLAVIIIPNVWPYKYDEQLGISQGNSDSSYTDLKMLQYGVTEQIQIAKYKAGINKNKTSDNKIVDFFVEDDVIYWKTSTSEKHELVKLIDLALSSRYDSKNGDIEFSDVESNGYISWNYKDSATKNRLIKFSNISNIEAKNVFPHLFGTDSLGRDYFIRVIYGARISLLVGFFASIIVLIIGSIYGSISGYLGGKVDLVMMRIVDIIYALPDMLIIILLSVVFKSIFADEVFDSGIIQKLGPNMISIFVVFGLLYWVGMARLIRGQILSLKEQEYILAAKSIGASSGRIIRKHLLPNCISVIIISTALQIPSAIFTESFLSFLGIGVSAPMPSLGSLASTALEGISSYTYRLVIPSVFICLIVLSLNLLGDGLRDAFDPKLNN